MPGRLWSAVLRSGQSARLSEGRLGKREKHTLAKNAGSSRNIDLNFQSLTKSSGRLKNFFEKLLTFCNAYNIINALQKVGDKLSPRTGRPKVDNPKSVNYTIRIDAATETRLREYCQKHNISRGEAIRQGIHLLLAQEK